MSSAKGKARRKKKPKLWALHYVAVEAAQRSHSIALGLRRVVVGHEDGSGASARAGEGEK